MKKLWKGHWHGFVLTAFFIGLSQVVEGFAASGKDTLVFAVDVIRHGDRTAFGSIPTAPHTWTEGLGELTATGITQEYLLGKKWRALYIDKWHLLPPEYAAKTIYVRSTDINRTLMSAQSVLLGLYPPGTGPILPDGKPAAPYGIQPIPIHTVAAETDSLLIPDSDKVGYQRLLERDVFSSPEWQEKAGELEPKFAQWSAATGIEITNLIQLESLGDTVFIYQRYHIPLPPGITNDAQTIVDAGHWVLAETYKPAEIGRVTGGTLLKAIAGYLQAASEGKSQLKYVLFSAHDTTLLSAMSCLRKPLTSSPPYASDLKFILFKTNQNDFRVEIRYNDQVVNISSSSSDSISLPEFL
ncbi:MAG TPA: histidine phosphatase family protein, partial [Candidatus Acidoferrum sp.]|nr:histidine phosphatase family protein [Candidatus Acidoferrum sp.]